MTMGQGGIFGNPEILGGVAAPSAPAGGFDIQGLLGNPLFNIGTGLLVAGLDNPRNFGQALGRGLQFGTQQMNAAQGRQLMQAKLAAHREAMEENARRRAASERLKGLLVPAGTGEAREPQPGDAQRQMMGLLADIAPEQFAKGLMANMVPQKPTNLQRQYEFLLSQGVSPEKALEALKKGTIVNVGGNEAMTVSDLTKIMKPDGSAFPPGTTLQQAVAAGGVVRTPEQQQRDTATAQSLSMLNRFERAVTENNIRPGFINEGGIAEFAATPAGQVVSKGMGLLGGNLEITPAQAEALSLQEQLGNQLLQAMRGASVGPEEQKKFEKQLPRLSQDAEVFKANLRNTRKNLEELARRVGRTGSSDGRSTEGGDRRFRFNPATGQLEPK